MQPRKRILFGLLLLLGLVIGGLFWATKSSPSRSYVTGSLYMRHLGSDPERWTCEVNLTNDSSFAIWSGFQDALFWAMSSNQLTSMEVELSTPRGPEPLVMLPMLQLPSGSTPR